MRVYVDSDVLIWHLRGHQKAARLLKKLHQREEYSLWIGPMQRAEILFHMRPEEERGTVAFLAQFASAAIDQRIVDRAAALYRQWHPSHGVDVNDALLAATVQETGGKILCLNTKHYPMRDVRVEKAW